MSEVNQHGLSRTIPEIIKRQIRRNSSFGCVTCRCGIYQYEHIDPEFKDAKKHCAEDIACLCALCHDRVTRGMMSKYTVRNAYEKIKKEVVKGIFSNPTGPLDLNVEWPSIQIGNLFYGPGLKTLIRHHGSDIIRFEPGSKEEPGQLFADIYDSKGDLSLKIIGNEWVGPPDKFDFRVEGKSLKIWEKSRDISLHLELQPPGRIVVQHLDMRIGNDFVIASDKTYAVGRTMVGGKISWMHVTIKINRCSQQAAAIEFTTDTELDYRDKNFGKNSQELATQDRDIVLNAFNGVMCKKLGLVIGASTGAHQIQQVAIGQKSLEEIRWAIKNHPDQLCRFISTGKVS